MKAYAAVLGTAVTLRLGLAAWSDGDVGIDRKDFDMPGSPFNLTSNASVECYNACMAAVGEGCAAWVMESCASPAVCWLKVAVPPQVGLVSCRISGTINNALLPPVFAPLPVGAVHPEGWLRDELQITADGLAGHLHRFWPDVENSSWIGGAADGGLHERFPYAFNGIVPMAHQLNDTALIAAITSFVDKILSLQAPSGWLGLDDTPTGNDQYWGRFFMLFALTAHYEATGDARIPPALMRFVVEARRRLWSYPMGPDSWSGARYMDFILSVHWLLENAPQGQEQMLWDLAETLHAQGFTWEEWFTGPSFPRGNVGDDFTLYTHGVNNGQAIKSGGVWYRQSHSPLDAASSQLRMQVLDKYHGMPSGHFSCDEHLGGFMPSHGTELCTIVETMFSYAVLHSIQGDAAFAERTESIGYNTLPAAFDKLMWDHPYLHQTNEIISAHVDPHVWITDGPDSTIYGLEPNYGCCTANFPQGWPKMLQRMVSSSTADMGIAVSILGPVSARVPVMGGASALVNVTTSYPFGDEVTITVTGHPAGTPLYVRIPSWATEATLNSLPVGAANGTMYKVLLGASPATLTLATNPTVRLSHWYNNSVAVFRGALMYSLLMPENITVLAQHPFNSVDMQVTSPGAVWNVALVVPDLANPASSLTFQPQGAVGSVPFSASTRTGVIVAKARQVYAWTEQLNAAGPIPASPIDCTLPGACGELVDVTLVPHGTTLLRIGEFPFTAQ